MHANHSILGHELNFHDKKTAIYLVADILLQIEETKNKQPEPTNINSFRVATQ